jgi:hypothetical protein
MIISFDNLKAGIKWWKEYKWGNDLLNAEYYDIYAPREGGVTEKWWAATVERLTLWHAYRGRKPPNTKAQIMQGGKDRLNEIAAQYTRLVRACAEEPSIAYLCWEDVEPLFAIASSIKPRSPVFAGKMCHFLFPKLFTVMDNWATGVFEYEFYWRGMKDEWGRFDGKTQAKSLLTEAIKSKSKKPLHDLYPFETKIMELRHVGYNCR